MALDDARSSGLRYPPPPPTAEGSFPDDVSRLPPGCTIDGADCTRPLTDEADFVVLGSGAGGATAAALLAENGFSVILLEEGPWVRTRQFGTDLWGASRRMFRAGGGAVTMGRSMLSLMQGRCVGGSTTINSAIAWRSPAEVLDAWSTEYGLGEHVNARRLEAHYEALERELSVRSISDESLGVNSSLLGLAAKKLGYEAHRIQRYDSGCEGTAGCLTGCRHGRKMSMNITMVPRALRAGARLYCNAHAERVEIRGGRAVGVLATLQGREGKPTLLVRARRGVLVAASTVQTPNLLRRSGLRNKHLGEHFQAHPGISIAGTFGDDVRMDYGATQGYNSLHFQQSDRLKFESISLPPELSVARLPGFGKELSERLGQLGKMAIWAVVMRSPTEGRVREGWLGERVEYNLSDEDVRRLRKGLQVLSEMLFEVGAKEVYPGLYKGMPSVLRSRDECRAWEDAPLDPQAYLVMASHLFGAARMAPDAARGVVGTDFQSHEARGLYVVDSSVFPTNLGVNPQHTIMAMARLCAAGLVERPPLPL